MAAVPMGFRVARYRFGLAMQQPWEAHGWPGNVLRGAFGWAFKRVCCVVEHHECTRCLLRRQCAYAYVFETAPPPDADRLRKLTDLPRPFVFEPPEHGGPGGPGGEETLSALDFNLVLIGRAIEYLPYFIFAFMELGRRGLGRKRTPFIVRTVAVDLPDGGIVPVYSAEDEILRDVNAVLTAADLLAHAQRLVHTDEEVPACAMPPVSSTIHNEPSTLSSAIPPHSLTLRFLTPTRLRSGGESLRSIQFHHLIRALLRRLSALCYFHCGAELDVDFRDLIRRAEGVEIISSHLAWQPQARYSRRQERKVKIGGFIGDLTFAGDLAPFMPLLLAGEWVHVGKGCVMGLGKYEIPFPDSHEVTMEG